VDNENDLKFTRFLREKAAEAEREISYRPNYFIGMLGSEGGYRTACKLLSSSSISEVLQRFGRKDESILP
jgi:5-methylcytosine-specific restriction protein A